MVNLTYIFLSFALDKAGFFDKLFNASDSMKQNIFLKILNPNHTGCSNIRGFMIEVTRDSEKKYEHNVSMMNETLVETMCSRENSACTMLPPLSQSSSSGMF